MASSSLAALLLLALCAVPASNAFSPSLSLRSPFTGALTASASRNPTRAGLASPVKMQAEGQGVTRGICPECGTPVTTVQPREKIEGQYYHTACVTAKMASGSGMASISAEELAELRNLAAMKDMPPP
eukprot:CAMPEP_0173390814 /NCGR_PEP_ID=MMETSP1356-20130122/16258_1 /TAXON_ID=77927 ORGANISM="Hemiselmis virescens, Strain PCC157" /NCGR_SAMPLE_ID=MMETSP1356 /ASSEMBLY_ACC=CAM_ASM_000847 /LENGTH=127 /DNA_ID=CAMNT_0014348293 /DNA_START=45 /DNA_END=425 /DNA_ORIENTATION=+